MVAAGTAENSAVAWVESLVAAVRAAAVRVAVTEEAAKAAVVRAAVRWPRDGGEDSEQAPLPGHAADPRRVALRRGR